ncbi:MAG: 3-oxoacyl-ACP reductase FabG [Dehalococcoidales bacterium]|nr:3-oxoacyl-ACP reductase FabG [Dehalococcoidales bacterium]
MKLHNKVAIITGGGTGIGKAISLAFADEGASLVIAARNTDRLEKTAAEIKAKGKKCLAIQTDISDEKQVEQMVEKAVKEFGKLDILVNNAAIGTYNNADVADMKLDQWVISLDVNLTGTMYCARHALKYMRPRKQGNIINIASVAGLSGVPKESPYSVSKWGVIGFTETLAVEAGIDNIRVNCISPGPTRTDEFDDWVKTSAKDAGISYDEMMKNLTDFNSIKKIAEPSEIAACAVFLASDDASAITGHNLIANCGFHIVHPNMIQ